LGNPSGRQSGGTRRSGDSSLQEREKRVEEPTSSRFVGRDLSKNNRDTIESNEKAATKWGRGKKKLRHGKANLGGGKTFVQVAFKEEKATTRFSRKGYYKRTNCHDECRRKKGYGKRDSLPPAAGKLSGEVWERARCFWNWGRPQEENASGEVATMRFRGVVCEE